MRSRLKTHFATKSGRVQRAKAPDMGEEKTDKCSLAERFIEDFTFGKIQAVETQQYAMLAGDSGIHDELLHSLAELGSRGVHPQNCQEQLKELILKQGRCSKS